jgi:hypothetical protein
MPRFLKAGDIPMKVRAPHLARYKSQLRDALLHPALSDTQRVDIKTKLSNIGQPKFYKGNSPTSGAVKPPEIAAPLVELAPDPSESAPPPIKDITPPVDEADPGPEQVSEPGETLADLLELSKDELLTKANDEGAEVFKSWNMTMIAETILSHRSAEE